MSEKFSPDNSEYFGEPKQSNGNKDSIEEVKNKPKSHHDPNTLPWHWALIIGALGCLLYYEIHILDHDLPSAISARQADLNPDLFSAERARTTLRKIVALGPRVVGDIANEEYTPALLQQEIQSIIREAHPSQKINIDFQSGNGVFKHEDFTSVYININNVIAMIEGTVGDHSILVNCHYDSRPETEGASDDAINCAIMLEIMKVLTSTKTRLKHNVVFLFNGAEETGLQGAHLFLRHEWNRKCRVFINMEAAGSGGRAMLFQAGPNMPWLLDYYGKYAPHPHGMVMAEEMYESGLIPSDTDFTIFTTFGNMSGYDMAFLRSGQMYHTKYDAEPYIPLGSYQHMGDNVLGILKALGNAPELDDPEQYYEGKAVYYDYMGWFIVRYSEEAGIAINIIIAILASLSITIFFGHLLGWPWLSKIPGAFSKLSSRKKSNADYDSSIADDLFIDGPKEIEKSVLMREFLISLVIRVFSIGISLGMLLIGVLIVTSFAPLGIAWYRRVWFIFPLLFAPNVTFFCFLPCGLDHWRAKKHNMSVIARTHMNLMVTQIPTIAILFVLTVIGYRSAYIFLLPVFFNMIGNLVIYLTPLFRSGYKWIWVYLLIQMPPLILNLYITLLIYIAVIPAFGRSGIVFAELYMGIICWALSIYVLSFIVPLVILLRRPVIPKLIITFCSFIILVLVLTTHVGHPYQSGPSHPCPQRYHIMHTLREFKNQTGHLMSTETGYFVLNLDDNSPKTMPSSLKTNMRGLDSDCEEQLLCGLPFYTTSFLSLSPESNWIPASRSYQPIDTELILKDGKKTCQESQNLCTFKFHLKGPDRMTLTFSPRNGASLDSWSLSNNIETPLKFKDRPAYLVHIVQGKLIADLEVILIFKVTREQMNGAPIIDIGLAGNHVHHKNDRTRDFQGFLDSMYDWQDRMGWISAYKGYIF